MRTIRVYGRLAKFLGRRSFRASVRSAAEAVQFLIANFPHVEAHIAQQRYHVLIGNRDITAEELREPAGQETISIVPVVGGAGAVARIIVGVALIAASIAIPGSALIFGTAVKGLVLGIGASLALGGVAQLLTPMPRMSNSNSQDDNNNDPRKNYSFSGLQNVTRAGVPVPIQFGKVLVGSVVISAGIDVDQVTA